MVAVVAITILFVNPSGTFACPSAINLRFDISLLPFNNNFTSAIAIAGNTRRNNKNKVKNNPNDPMKMATSTHVG